MSKFLLICFVISILLGCSELQRKQVDEVVIGTDDFVDAVNDAVEGPGGALIPPEYRAPIILAAGVIGLLTGIWKDFRSRQARNALTEVIIGVDILKKLNDETGAAVKDAMNSAQGGATRKLVEKVRSGI